MSQNNAENGGIFINGKKQVVELLQRMDLNDESLKTLLSQTKPTILGLALSLCHVKNQRRALSLISREMALKAFDILQKDLTSNRHECLKAQQKILELAMGLNRSRIIQFY